jgi:hypothetical protein
MTIDSKINENRSGLIRHLICDTHNWPNENLKIDVLK